MYRCRFPLTCIPYSAYKKVNPSSQIIIDGFCMEGCATNTIAYKYSVYFTYDLNLTTDNKWQSMKNLGFILGK